MIRPTRRQDAQTTSTVLPGRPARADSLLARSLADLARGPIGPIWGTPARLDTTVRVDAEPIQAEDNEATIRPFFSDDASDLEPAVDDEAEVEAAWRGRLAYDAKVSVISPVVVGTWVTVARVVSLIVDGSTWADILRAHPELTEDDLRACLAFAHEDDAEFGPGELRG